MAHRPIVLMLDEPTAALDMQLAAQLEEIIKQARDAGTAIVYVSHRLEEIRRLADRLTVLRDGEIQGSFESERLGHPRDRRDDGGGPHRAGVPDPPNPRPRGDLLEVHELTGLNFGPVSLEVRAGEIVGVAGAEGNGQRALLRGIIGIDRTGGSTVRCREVDLACDTGVSPRGRHQLPERRPGGRVDLCAPVGHGQRDDPARPRRGPRRAGPEQPAPAGVRLEPRSSWASSRRPLTSRSAACPEATSRRSCSARPALKTPKVLIVDEPTQGVDAKARLDIYKVIADAADDGIAVLMNSSDSSELAGLCDRVYVMNRGTVIKELAAPTTEREIVHSFVSATDVDRVEDLPLVGKSSWAARLLHHSAQTLPIAVLLILIALVAGYTGSQTDVFWTSFNLTNLLVLTLPLAFVALGQQFAMIGGLIDISVGSTMSLAVVLISVTLPDMTAGSRAEDSAAPDRRGDLPSASSTRCSSRACRSTRSSPPSRRWGSSRESRS